jgi:hypothetical protein
MPEQEKSFWDVLEEEMIKVDARKETLHWFEELRKQAEDIKQPHVCPHCGRCPACGRGYWLQYPVWPWQWQPPYVTFTYSDSAGTIRL